MPLAHSSSFSFPHYNLFSCDRLRLQDRVAAGGAWTYVSILLPQRLQSLVAAEAGCGILSPPRMMEAMALS